MVVERMLGLFSLVSTVAIGLMLAPVELPGVLDGLVAGSLLALLGAGLLLALAAPRRLARRILSISVLARLRQALSGIERRVDGYLHRPGPLLGALVLAFAFQGLRILTVIVGAAALGLDVDPTLLVVIVPVTILVSLLPISMSGLGPREASYVALLGFAGVAPAAALALALTRELLNVATALPGAVLHLQAPLGSRT